MAAYPTVIWYWIIEALAGFEKVDTMTLIALVKMAPGIFGNLGKNAREIVSLRILESLFGNETIVDADSVKNSRISFDLSERCEDVLKKILNVDLSERCEDVLKKILNETPEQTKFDKEKWDVGSFIKHKKSSLPKCTLKKLKEAILESDHPLLASLKEKSHLVIPNSSENKSRDFDRSLNVEKDKNKSQENVSQESDQVGDSTGLDVEKDKNKSQENVSQEVGDSTRETTEHNEREECEAVTEPLLEGSGGKIMMEHEASEINDDNMHQDSPTEENGKRISVDNTENLESGVKSKDPQNIGRCETSFDISAQKEAFLNSQCALNQDSLTMSQWSEINDCIKCNKDGRVLVCSSEMCLLRVHEGCLGSPVTRDENGNFLCPFCAYSRSISVYQEAKKKALMARNNLQAFSNFTPNKSSKKQNEDIGEPIKENNNNGDKDSVVVPDEPLNLCENGDRSLAANQNEGEGCESFTRIEEHQVLSRTINENVDMEIEGLNLETTKNQTPGSSRSKRKYKEKGSEDLAELSCSKNLRKRKTQKSSNFLLPPWTKLEEETLREGVKRFFNGDKETKIPWKKILDFGEHVFMKERTTTGLKLKWKRLRAKP